MNELATQWPLLSGFVGITLTIATLLLLAMREQYKESGKQITRQYEDRIDAMRQQYEDRIRDMQRQSDDWRSLAVRGTALSENVTRVAQTAASVAERSTHAHSRGPELG